jgi:hypothetical protein
LNLRQVVAAWVLALVLVGALTLGPVMLRDRAEARSRSDIVVIGSSLTAYAVPETGGGAASLLGDGRPHRRFAALRITERQVLARLERAINQRAATILLEINPLLVDFADRPYQRPCDG